MTLDPKSHILLLIRRIASAAVLLITADPGTIAKAQSAKAQSAPAGTYVDRYGETQIGYPTLRASRTTPAAAATIPAESIADEPDAATVISQLPPVRFNSRLLAKQGSPGKAIGKRAKPSPMRASMNWKPKAKAMSRAQLLAGIKPTAKRRAATMRNSMRLRSRKSAPRGWRDNNRVQANLKGVAIDGMSSINYQRLLGRQLAFGIAAQHFQYLTPQGAGKEQGSGIGGEMFARVKPFHSLRKHEGIFVSMGLGMMGMNWEQSSDVIGGGERVVAQQGLYRTLSGGVSYQTPIYGSLLVEPRLDYILFNPVDSDSSKAVQRFEPTVAFGFGF